jgi:hypothetical protein
MGVPSGARYAHFERILHGNNLQLEVNVRKDNKQLKLTTKNDLKSRIIDV